MIPSSFLVGIKTRLPLVLLEFLCHVKPLFFFGSLSSFQYLMNSYCVFVNMIIMKRNPGLYVPLEKIVSVIVTFT